MSRTRGMQALFVIVTLALLAAGVPAADAQTRTLTINVSGNATGNVAVSRLGLLCRHTNTSSTTTCPFQINHGTDITLSSNVPAPSSPGMVTGGTGEFGNLACIGSSTCRKSLLSDSSIDFVIDSSNPTVTLTINLIAGQPAGVVAADGNVCPRRARRTTRLARA